jgi:hypothetical protein
MKICAFLPTTIFIDESCSLFINNFLADNNTRVEQYKKGIDKFIELIHEQTHIDDIYISDNSSFFQNNQIYYEYLNNKNIKILLGSPNIYGKINKGSGLLENWLHHINVLKQYDYIVHFEPRQILIDNSFIEYFLKHPHNLFTLSQNKNSFNTGLFVIKSDILVDFITKYSAGYISDNKISIEDILYMYMINNNIQFNTVEKMNLSWHDTFANTYRHM